MDLVRALQVLLATQSRAAVAPADKDSTSYNPNAVRGRTWREAKLEEAGGSLRLAQIHHTTLQSRFVSKGKTCLYALACLLAYETLSLPSCAFAQTEDYFIPSPQETSSVLKQNILARSGYYVELATRFRDGHLRSAKVVGGVRIGNREAGDDGVVVGWIGEEHLTVGWPSGDPFEAGPARIGNVEIAYMSYERDLEKASPRRAEQVTLRDVQYKAEATIVGGGIHCSITVIGVDGRYFNNVSLKVIGYGASTTREENRPGWGSVSVQYELEKLQGLTSPQLTPTRAKLADIPPQNDAGGPLPGPEQQGLSLKYNWYGITNTRAIFRTLKDGNYVLKFDLSFGEQRIDYLVPEPITAEAAVTFQKCEARTQIFDRLIGFLLTN